MLGICKDGIAQNEKSQFDISTSLPIILNKSEEHMVLTFFFFYKLRDKINDIVNIHSPKTCIEDNK